MTAETIKESEEKLVAKVAAEHKNKWKADEFKTLEECIAAAIRASFAARPVLPEDVLTDMGRSLADAMSLYPGSRETPDYAVNVAHFLCFGASSYAANGTTPPPAPSSPDIQCVREGFIVVERRLLENAHRFLDLGTGPAGARAAFMEINAIFEAQRAAKVTK